MMFGRAVQAHLHQQVVALALVEGFLLTDAHHGARVRAVGAAAQRDLVDDGGAVDQPADHADVGPAERGVIEDAGVLRAAGVQVVDQVVARHAQGFRGAVQVEPVAGLVLDLGQQDGLALERRRAGDPVAFGQHAHDFGVRVLGNLAHEGLAVGLRHPVLGLDADAVVDAALKRLFLAFELVRGLDLLDAGFDELCVHVCLLETVCENAKQTFRSAVMS